MGLVNQYSDSMNLTAWCKQALMQLHAAKYNSFIYVVSFLREVLKHQEKNGVTVDHLVLVFSGCLMHSPPVLETSQRKQQQQQQQRGRHMNKPKAWRIMLHFLVSDEFAG